MKKLIITLSVLAIASLNFVKPVMAQYRVQDLKEAQAYKDKLAERGFTLDYANAGFNEKLAFAKQICADGNFDLAMTRIKKSNYPLFVSILLLLNTDRFEVRAYKRSNYAYIANYCDEKTIKYPTIFDGI